MKSTLIKLLLPSFFLILTLQGTAQEMSRTYRKLITAKVQRQLEDSLPLVAAERARIENFTDSVQVSVSLDSITLPVAFHIFNPAGGGNLVNESQIQLQLNALNRDFGNEDYSIRHKADTLEDFYGLVADMGISFCLADYSLNGSSLSAIHYIQSSDSTWPPNQSIKNPLEGGVAPWDPEKIINVWVANLEEGVSGFAQMPGGPSVWDGIVMDYRFFATSDTSQYPYAQGKTLTHLMGNYLNLYSLWGDGTRCSDDRVDDTPIHNAPNYGIPVYKHISTCGLSRSSDRPQVEMTMNFMDNSDDTSLYMFTHGQKRRLHAILSPGGPRHGLLSGGQSQCNPGYNFRMLQSPNSPVEEEILKTHLEIYPNPAQNHIHVIILSPSNGNAHIRIYSTLGSLIKLIPLEIHSGTREYIIDASQLASGAYYLQLDIGDSSLVKELIVTP